MKRYDVIIIGSGLGGLISAAILSKEGKKVLVLERGKKFGGFLHTFKRDQTVFNTGMNYAGSLEKGGFLFQYLNYLGIMDDLDIKRLDINGFDEISFSNQEEKFVYAQGKENFISQLSKSFPEEEKTINSYVNKIWEVTNKFPMLHLNQFDLITKGEDYLIGGASEYIDDLSKNSRLKNVLAATNSLYAGVKNTTPLYVHSLVNRQFIESTWRFVGGSMQLATLLAKKIEQAGGELKNRSQVSKISTEESDNSWVETEDGEKYFAKNIISNIHPSKTFEMLADKRINQVYRRRINELPNTKSFFNIYIVFKKDVFPYINKNIYHFVDHDVWAGTQKGKPWPSYFMFYTGVDAHEQKWATNASVLTSMDYEEVLKWKGTIKGQRGGEYEAFKQEKADKLLAELENRFSGIKSKIHAYYTATPLTYEHYIAAPQGAGFGIEKNHHQLEKSIILPKTKIPNLFFTGQNLNMNGALGVTIGAVDTCSELLGRVYLINKIKNTL